MAQTRVGVRVPSIWNGLLSYYRADGTPNDQLGNYNGTLVNGTTYNTGIINQGFSFDGVNDSISLTDTMNTFSSSETFSYNVWINPKANNSTRVIYARATTMGGYSMYIVGGKLSLAKGDVNTQFTHPSAIIPINTWTMCTITYNGNVNQPDNLLFYINGVLVGGLNMNINSTSTVATVKYIGSGGWRGYFNGMIDELGVWNKVLKPSEIDDLYNGGNGFQK